MEKKQLYKKTNLPTISAIIITKNEAEMLPACLECLAWCDELIVLDTGSTDETPRIAERYGARLVHFKHDSFARLREEAAKHVKSDWLLYVDADERVLPKLAKEILVNMETNEAEVIKMQRKNIFFGKPFSHGGWGNDIVTRGFLKSALSSWHGNIHESPVYTGTTTLVTTPLVHLTHRNTRSGLVKTATWTWMEAQELFEAKIPDVTIWTLVRKGVMEFVRRVIVKKGWKDGTEGIIEGIIQAWNRIIVYIQVWELQQSPSIPDKYQRIESEIAENWKKV